MAARVTVEASTPRAGGTGSHSLIASCTVVNLKDAGLCSAKVSGGEMFNHESKSAAVPV